MAKVKEIFESVQGEGLYVGCKQLFVRFCGCNLNCEYCDTDFDDKGAKEYTAEELADICNRSHNCHSVALTGGEPLIHADFINEFASKIKLPVYLETNGTLCEQLLKVIDYVTYISADIKLPSCAKLLPLWDRHEQFFKVASQKNLFAKVVFDENITDDEIARITDLCKKYKIELVLQPKMDGNKLSVASDFMQRILNKCLEKYDKTRVIPQVHKFLNFR